MVRAKFCQLNKEIELLPAVKVTLKVEVEHDTLTITINESSGTLAITGELTFSQKTLQTIMESYLKVPGNMATCNEFLNFKPTMNPSWRCSIQQATPDAMPSIDKMMHEIAEYQKIYEKHKNSIADSLHKKTIRHFLCIFMLNVEREEDVGVQDYGKTKEIIEKYDGFQSASKLPDVSEYEKSAPDANNIAADEVDKTQQLYSNSPNDTYLGGLEEELVKGRNLIASKNCKLKKSELETKNLCEAYIYLDRELQRSKQEDTKKNENNCVGLLDVESCIQESHKILMNGVMNDEKTRPGIFSTKNRSADFKGQIHEYPKFASEEVAFNAMQALVDKHNSMTEEIRLSEHATYKKLEYSFKSASLFLFGFLTLHPFSDGNGRLGRLLASYCLLTMNPFMTPIYNVFSSSKETDYVDSLVNAREKLQLKENIDTYDEAKKAVMEILKHCPEDLCAMMIESNWAMWRQFLVKLGILELRLFDWENTNSQMWHNNAN